MKKMLRARFDGGCVPNPEGHCSCACLIVDGVGGKEVYRKSSYLGEGGGMTNNVAEYAGLKLILEWLVEHQQPCLIIGDSTIVINRMSSRTRSGGAGSCASLALECKALLDKIKTPVEFLWQKRTRNEDCDAMCTAEIELAKNAEWSSQFQ